MGATHYINMYYNLKIKESQTIIVEIITEQTTGLPRFSTS